MSSGSAHKFVLKQHFCRYWDHIDQPCHVKEAGGCSVLSRGGLRPTIAGFDNRREEGYATNAIS